MTDNELFEFVLKNYSEENREYIKEQVKVALKDQTMTKQDALNGLLDWIVDAGCCGMNEYYRKFVFAAIAYLI